MKVLFLQRSVVHYRVPFFNAMARLPGREVTVAHSGRRVGAAAEFHEHALREFRFASLHWQRELLPLCRRHDVVIAPFDVHFVSSVRMALARNRPPLIWWGIGLGRSQRANRLRVWLTRRARAVVAYTPGNANRLAEAGVDRSKLFCAPNTVHVPNAAPKPEGGAMDSFLFVGSINARKRVDELLEAFARARESLPAGTTLNVVGAGPCEPELRELTARLGLAGAVVFHGRIEDDARLQPLFHRAYALVSPGQVGLTLLQSFGHGTAVITRQDAISGGELENLKSGENGLFYSGGAAELAAVMTRVATTPGLAAELGRRAYEHYSGSTTIAHMARGFDQAIAHVLRST
ncbi:MAG: glycosyltransferase family 4 protein [Phycisphaerales bacterium]|nr:glycosyltransferase family 4 protein [Phycisphaerales bacterium]